MHLPWPDSMDISPRFAGSVFIAIDLSMCKKQAWKRSAVFLGEVSMDRENSAKIKEIYHIIVFLTAVALVTGIFVSGDIGKSFGMDGYNSQLLRFDGWKIRSSDSDEPVELPCYLWGRSGPSYITNTLPRALGAGSFLAFRSSGCIVRVYVGESLIYSNTQMYERTVREAAVYNYVPVTCSLRLCKHRGGGFLLKHPTGCSINRLSPCAPRFYGIRLGYHP